MRAIIVGDLHLSDRPPSIRTESYRDDILRKLDWIVAEAQDRSAEVLLFAGDVFHIKTPNRTSHELVQRVADTLSTSGIPALIVPGNHDMQHDRLDTLERQPLGTLSKVRGVDLLIGWHSELPVFGLPFLPSYEVKMDGKRVRRPLLDRWMIDWHDGPHYSTPKSDWLMLTHAPLMPQGVTQPYETISQAEWGGKMDGGTCYYGHIHEAHGRHLVALTHEDGHDSRTVFLNEGAISRGSLHESSLKRRPAVTLYDSSERAEDGGPWTLRIEVPHRPAEEVFRLATHRAEEARTEKLDEFLQGIEETTLDAVSVESVLQHAAGLGLQPDTMEEIRSCIEEALTK